MALIDRLFGPPLATAEEEGQRVGPLAGVPMLGLDALASAAYGPEAALTVLLPLGLLGLAWIGPITAAIIALLIVLYLSYRQTIAAYPAGAGSYTVAKENLGDGPGLLAAAALLLDYVLVVAVGISAGVGALISAAPALQPYTLPLCLAMLAFIALVNLRGVRELGIAFIVPTDTVIASCRSCAARRRWCCLTTRSARGGAHERRRDCNRLRGDRRRDARAGPSAAMPCRPASATPRC